MFIATLIVLLSACSNNNDQNSTNTDSSGNGVKDTVLVNVNGQPITRRDLEIALLRMLEPGQVSSMDEEARRRVLEGMVMSRVISQSALTTMSAEEKTYLEHQASHYREELLVKHYLKENLKAEPVTQEMVEAYYQNNIENYGGGVEIRFTLLTSLQNRLTVNRDKIIDALNNAITAEDWNYYIADLKKTGIKLQIQSGSSNDRLLHNRIRSVIHSMAIAETSKTIIIDGKPYIIRITDRVQHQAKPLNEVSAEIRRTLAPVRLKSAIKLLSDELLKTANVQYTSQ